MDATLFLRQRNDYMLEVVEEATGRVLTVATTLYLAELFILYWRRNNGLQDHRVDQQAQEDKGIC